MATILIDYDGTCVPKIQKVGYCKLDVGGAAVIRRLQECGHTIILWTCRNSSKNNPFNYTNGVFREETSLNEAVSWFEENGIKLDGINEVPGEENIIGYSRKALGDIIIDDTSIGMSMCRAEVPYVDYATGEVGVTVGTFVDWNYIGNLLTMQGLLIS